MATCYRHPDRETNVSCSNCGRPICPDCMTSTSVGMRCPECARQRTQVRNPVGAATSNDAPATYAIIGLCIAAFFGQMVSGGSVTGREALSGFEADFAFFAPIIDADGEWYRTITYGFLHSGLFHLAINMFVLYILGTLLEPVIGTARFVAIYLISILGGALGVTLIDEFEVTVGASGGIFGLMAAAFLVARQRGLDDLASQIGFLVVLNLVITFAVPNISIGGHLGGLVAGGVSALALSAVERSRGRHAGAIDAAVLGGIALAVALATVVAIDGTAPPGLS
jgi:membrane associated rhomboid family serine protease